MLRGSSSPGRNVAAWCSSRSSSWMIRTFSALSSPPDFSPASSRTAVNCSTISDSKRTRRRRPSGALSGCPRCRQKGLRLPEGEHDLGQGRGFRACVQARTPQIGFHGPFSDKAWIVLVQGEMESWEPRVSGWKIVIADGIYRIGAVSEGGRRAASCLPAFAHSPWVGARVGSHRSPILRPGHGSS